VKNTIEAHIAFSYKGDDYNLSNIIDLDSMMENQTDSPDFHLILAQQNDIDTYSYLYEVMESHEITFSNAKGIAADCLTNNHIDLQKFRTLWQEQRAVNIVQVIAKEHLDIEDLNQAPQLKTALLAAFLEGKKEVNSV
jgi:hypothetical protein